MFAWVNYHNHCHFCDGSADPHEYVKEALISGMPAFGFSSHGPVPFKADWCIQDSRLDEYLGTIRNIQDEYKNKIQIYLGMEVDFIPGISGRSRHLIQNTRLDYFIGSIHFVDRFDDGTYWNIDTSYEIFLRGLTLIFKNDFRKAATRFYEITRQMIEEDKPDVIGHLDKIKMYNLQGKFFNENEKWYRDQVDLTVKSIRKQNCIVEINTRGKYKYGQEELYPGNRIITQMNKLGIPFMISSDSHHPSEIIKGMDYAAEVLSSRGVEKVYALFDAGWRSFYYTPKGLAFRTL